MVVCVCRNIRESDYPNPQQLEQRIMQQDFRCGQCQLHYLLKTAQSGLTQLNLDV